MKRFIVQTGVFISFPILFFGLNMLLNYHLYKTEPLKIEQTNILIAGDSHTQKSLNPQLFNSAQNISQPGEPYVLTFWKLRKFFESVIPDTLIVGFSPNNIAAYNDLKFSDEKWSSEMFARSYAIQYFEEISSFICIDYKMYYGVLWKKTGFYPKKHHLGYIGSYSNSPISNITDWKSRIDAHFFYRTNAANLSSFSIRNLRSIAALCAQNNVTLVLVGSPVHKNYYKNIPKNIVDAYYSLAANYAENAILIDALEADYPDSLFYDIDHLNEYGATKFTRDVVQYLINQ